MSQERFRQLLNQYISDELSPAEKAELQQMMQQPEYAETLDAFVREIMVSEQFSEIDSPVVKAQLDNYLSKHIDYKKSIHRLSPRLWLRVAAAIIVLLGTAGLFFYFNQPQRNIAATHVSKQQQDVLPPANDKAVITLANGKQINLNDVATGAVTSEANADIIKLADGRIMYNVKGKSSEVALNLLTVPRGTTPVHLTLSDGSHIWVNAASSLKYPAVFTGNNRTVEIAGEAYFEIAPDKNAPFIVKKINTDTRVQVLGTHFNVNAYDNEKSIEVTLMEGAVNVVKGNVQMRIKPRQQAVVKDDDIQLNNTPDLEKIMSWKNNEFIFENDDIESIMRQLERWYDIEAIIKEPSDRRYIGRINRNVPLSQVLDMFEKLGYINFEINDKKVTVIPIDNPPSSRGSAGDGVTQKKQQPKK
jgi:ferric-dicitrate binding protein FerR (iron transport regulator)